ncbi:hypothetical protein BMR02_11415 [Methylococcaceae bacterium HT1]|nr:hypothetical protein BMR02_11405 [Methylococcaceae bacterium HT1]TXK96569.1 hypothetical protein BMR02_11415 [Methylococcaceae bacterium HT1]TXL22011.1 hypothetical protein BMR03_10730 [Methylococcaceae bacterium HT2]
MSTSEKSVSSSLHHIEQQLADKNPALLQAFRLYHELDQVAFDLGLIGMDDSLANKTSWSPIITVIGDPSSGRDDFINRYLDTAIPAMDSYGNHAQFTVLIHRADETPMSLPGTAVDGDPRFPFYHISDRLEQIEKGESRNINTYLELKTNNSPKLKDKTIILTPGFSANLKPEGVALLREHAATLSDLVFVFFDASEPNLEDYRPALAPFLNMTTQSHNPGKFIYVINQPPGTANTVDLASWKQQLSNLGLQAGQFFVLKQSTESNNQQAIEQKLTNIDVESAYRILHTLERHIDEFDSVVISEVKKAIRLWKDRTHFTVILILSLIALSLVAGEISFGLVALLLDPFVASIGLFLLILFLIPFHIYSSKVHAKFITKKLLERQTELGLIENLPALFEKSLTLWRILLPYEQPVGWTTEVMETLDMIKTRAKGLVQSLNNTFNSSISLDNNKKEDTFLNL